VFLQKAGFVTLPFLKLCLEDWDLAFRFPANSEVEGLTAVIGEKSRSQWKMPDVFLARVPGAWWDAAGDFAGKEANARSVCFPPAPFPGVVSCFSEFFAL